MADPAYSAEGAAAIQRRHNELTRELRELEERHQRQEREALAHLEDTKKRVIANLHEKYDKLAVGAIDDKLVAELRDKAQADAVAVEQQKYEKEAAERKQVYGKEKLRLSEKWKNTLFPFEVVPRVRWFCYASRLEV